MMLIVSLPYCSKRISSNVNRKFSWHIVFYFSCFFTVNCAIEICIRKVYIVFICALEQYISGRLNNFVFSIILFVMCSEKNL